MPRRLLIVAYHFPPVRVSSGIQRTLKFCTYLREHGWQPIVLTVTPGAYELVSDDQMKEIPPDVIVERAWCVDTARSLSVKGRYFRWMAQPDRWVSWWPAGVAKGMSLIRRHRPDAIMSTFPIATAHLIGHSLQRLSGLPWVADFRDSMTEEGYPRDAMTWGVHRRIESMAVKRCAKAVFTTRGTLEMYAERYPSVPASHWTIIENGFDEENFREAEAGLPSAPLGPPGQLTLIHSGLLYPQERDPRPFFEALSRLEKKGEITADTLQVVMRATGTDDYYRDMLGKLGLLGIVRLEPSVGYRAALQEMLRADGLLLFQGSICNHQIPAKLYEYFRAGRPIFALTDPVGNSAETLRSGQVTDIADISDTDAIENALLAFLAALRGGRRTGVPKSVAGLHSRRSRTAELARVLDDVVSSSGR